MLTAAMWRFFESGRSDSEAIGRKISLSSHMITSSYFCHFLMNQINKYNSHPDTSNEAIYTCISSLHRLSYVCVASFKINSLCDSECPAFIMIISMPVCRVARAWALSAYQQSRFHHLLSSTNNTHRLALICKSFNLRDLYGQSSVAYKAPCFNFTCLIDINMRQRR